MNKEIISSVFIAIFGFGYAIYIYSAEEPFFIGTEFLKHKPTEWLYETLGRSGSIIFFLIVGCLSAYWAYKAILSHGKNEI